MTANAPIPAIANAIFDACGVRLDRDAVHAGARAARAGRAAGVLIEALGQQFAGERYFADEGLLTAVHLALTLRRPLILEGEPGVGKTELAKVLASVLDRELIRLQCYEGLDAAQALYEWDHPKQLLAIRACEAEGRPVGELYDPEFLMERPLLRALRGAVRAADRRDRPRGLGVRGVPARVPERLPDHDPGAGDDREPRRRPWSC